MKSLYHPEYFSYTDEARKISMEFESVFKIILKKYFEMGYSPREIAAIAHDIISIVESETCLIHSSKKRKRGK